VLNRGAKGGREGEGLAAPDSRALAAELRQHILNLKAEHLSEDGETVDYDGMRQSDSFAQYVVATSALAAIDLDDMDETEKVVSQSCVVSDEC
jgi:hypothetical protein